MNSCQATGGWTGFCSSLFPGAVLAAGMTNTQSADLRSVTGTFALGTFSGTGNGSVSADGTLAYTGVANSGTTRIELQNWTATSATPGAVTGTFEQQWSDTTLAGTARLFCINLNLTRTSGGTSLARPSASPAGFEQMISMLQQR
jgi:hypothetical protein